MKVLMISNKPGNGGGVGHWAGVVIKYIETYMRDLIDFKEIPIYGYHGIKHSLYERFVINGADLFRIKKDLIQLCRSDKPDVVHITATGEWSLIRDLMILRIANKYSVPVVYHIHFGRIPEFKERNNINWKMICRCFKRASSIWAIDQNTLNTIAESYPNKKIEYMPNPVQIDDLSMSDNSGFDIMYLGWLVKTKGIEELLQAFNRLLVDYPNIKLKLVGPYKEDYLEYLKSTYDLSNVIITGKQEHNIAMDMLNDSRIFILPSYTEGFPNVILEAMAIGKPIIATNVGAIPDMLSDECGIVINSHSINEIESACRQLLSNEKLCNMMAENAYNKVRDNYSVSVVLNNYYNKWREVSSV